MATNIFNYNGSLLTTVQDGTIATTVASLSFPGRGYQNYGEAVNQDMLWIMQNFANASPPTYPVTGQLWYDTVNALMKFYSGSVWIVVGGVFLSGTAPVSGNNIGAFWYDTTNKQLNIWNGSVWNLLGPLGSEINTDPQNPTVPTYSLVDSVRVSDSLAAYHQIWRITVGGSLLAIFSKDAQFTPLPAITGFATLSPGLNISTAIAGAGIWGDLGVFTSTQNNLPSANNTWNMGSPSFNFANTYSTNFIGIASSAEYSDVAERYKSDAPLSPGTVVCLGGREEVSACRNLGDDGIFGVVSTNPAYLMNSKAGEGDEYPAIAMIGRVPCKVMGPVYKGQRIMASATEGVACAWNSNIPTISILGRSLIEIRDNSTQMIEVVLGKN